MRHFREGLFVFSVYECLAYLYVCAWHAHSACGKLEEGLGIPWHWVTDGCEPPSGFEDPNLATRLEKEVLRHLSIPLFFKWVLWIDQRSSCLYSKYFIESAITLF